MIEGELRTVKVPTLLAGLPEFQRLQDAAERYRASLPDAVRVEFDRAVQRDVDVALYGNAYVDADGNRVDPATLRAAA